MEVSFFLPSDVPGKKNSRMMTRGRLITDPTMQRQLAALTLMARARWAGRPALTDAEVSLQFLVSHKRRDLDNTAASVMDVLKDAGCIKNDSMKHVRRIEASFLLVRPGDEGVEVSLRGEVKC